MDIKNSNFSGRLPLNGASNTRDLGGYATDEGKVTNYRIFLRSDGICHCDEKDITFLKEYPVKTVIDFRNDEELKAYPPQLKDVKGINYENVQFNIKEMKADITKEVSTFNVAKGYVKLIEAKEIIRDIFKVIANNDEGCILFNCMSGKDRTGLVAMLLLGLAGVGKADIIANYQVSFTYMCENPRFIRDFSSSNSKVFYSKADNIKSIYSYITDKYKNFYNYLLSCDISKEDLEKIKYRFTK